MTGKLALIATAGLTGAAVFLALGTALSGSSWASSAYLWNAGATCAPASGTQRQITLPFTSEDKLAIEVPGTVSYSPGEKAEAVISGDSALIDHLKIESGRLALDCDPGWLGYSFDVKLSGPAITTWDLLGTGDLMLAHIDQPRLQVSVKGNGNISATGTSDVVDIGIYGSGKARFEGLIGKSATVQISGSGDASVNATSDADVSIFGSGNVELSGHPTMRHTEIRGSGRIVQVP